MNAPTPADFTSDLAALEHRQSLLHAALAAYQSDPDCLGDHGLALYHRLAVLNGEHCIECIEAVLVHAAGGEISSGFLPLPGPGSEPVLLTDLQRITADLLLGPGRFMPEPSTTQKAQRLAPIPLQQEPPAAAAPEPEPEPEPAAAAPEPPTKEEVAALAAALDRVFMRRPSAIKEMADRFRAAFGITARTPIPKALTTRERADWIQSETDRLIQEIAEFDQAKSEAEVTP